MRHPVRFCVVLAIATLLASHSAVRGEAPRSQCRAVPFSDVQIRDRFWAPRQETNRAVSVPLNLEMLASSGNIRNLELAAERKTTGYTGPVFMDSDLYKALEAASYALATHPDPALEARIDAIIAKIAAAQQSDGYLNTYFTVKEPGRRWTNLRDNHELYCAGHLIEAAVAHHQATGKTSLLDIARRFADHIDSVFGPGKRLGYPGHPELELALVKLARATGERRFFELARFFIENRGRKYFAEEHKTPPDRYDGTYWQDDVPIFEHRAIKGHAVRAAYLLSGATDVAAETGDPRLLAMIDRVWKNTTRKNMYVTGGIGPSAHNEGFTVDYDLPNLTAYQETCASVALAQWNHRLALLHGDAKYVDVFERSLYNGALAGVALDGKSFFYVNPLESAGNHHRAPWFGCACCPPNIARTIASLGGYAYATSDDGLWVNLYIQGDATARIKDQPVKLSVTTDYPWDGRVTVQPNVASPARFDLRLRVPGWCRGATVAVNGEPLASPRIDRGYFVLSREWKPGDTVVLDLPMPVDRIAANPNVKADTGLVALQRGPIVYCLEACDQPEPIDALYLPAGAGLTSEPRGDLLGGVVVVKARAESAAPPEWTGQLYQAVAPVRSVPIVAVPYYAWDNRKPGPMKVWLPTAPAPSRVGGAETRAKVSLSYVSGNCHPRGINDGKEPARSSAHPGALCHWWPHKGGNDWAQYTWSTATTLSGARVYWFDDTGSGACRLPASWRIEYLDGSTWKPVSVEGDYPVALDRWCSVRFAPVTTTALRLVVGLQSQWAAGVHEWQVEEAETE
ncbi:MAG: glycoside hydrolase family 127 protein [Isosphaeraceae bacterium]